MLESAGTLNYSSALVLEGFEGPSGVPCSAFEAKDCVRVCPNGFEVVGVVDAVDVVPVVSDLLTISVVVDVFSYLAEVSG